MKSMHAEEYVNAADMGLGWGDAQSERMARGSWFRGRGPEGRAEHAYAWENSR